MKKRIMAAKKVAKARLARMIARGRSPFHGAQSATGDRDPKDLRGIRGLLLRNVRGEEGRFARVTLHAPFGTFESHVDERRVRAFMERVRALRSRFSAPVR
jgi:hypothetical protein